MHFLDHNFPFMKRRDDAVEPRHGGTSRRGDTYGSWTVLGVGAAKEVSLAKLRALEMQQQLESPTTTLSIGMDCFGESGSVEQVPGPAGGLKKTVSWSHLENAVQDRRLATSPLDIGPKRKRGMLGRSEHEGSSCFEESEIVLALGSSPQSCPGVRQGGLNTVLGLGQADSTGSGSSSRENLLQNSCSSSLRSAESDVHLGLGRFSATCRNLDSFEHVTDVPLSLGLSRNSEDAYGQQNAQNEGSGMFVGFGQSESLLQKQYIPVVDEGSSSARWTKSGGVMPSLLQNHHRASVPEPCTEDYESYYSEDDYVSEHGLETTVRGTTSTASGISEKAPKICKARGCGKGARGASGLCIAHGGGRRCQKHGCSKGAEGRTVYCKAHGGGKRCQSLGCTKSAEGKTDYCISHGGGRRCIHEGCGKAARGRSGLCIKHGGGKRCQHEGCTKSAEGFSGLCISHGGGRRCQAPSCTKGAQGSTMFCKAHGGGKRCMIEGCGKGAEGSTPLCKGHGGGKRCMFEGGGICPKSVHGGTHFCVAHGGGKRCAVPGCSKSARGRTAYCVRHGGGKRCRMEGCGKSAQGSTDFCKAHGGGKRCIWGQEGAPYGPQGDCELSRGPCDRFARGKLGLCAAHSSMVLEEKGHGVCFAPGLAPGLFRGLVSQGSTVTSISNGSVDRNGLGEQHAFLQEAAKTDHWTARSIESSQHHVESTAAVSGVELQQPSRYNQPWPAFMQGSGGNLGYGSDGVIRIDGAGTGGFNLHGPSQPLIPSQVLVPMSMQQGKNTAESSVPEGRVHGGGLLALLAQGVSAQS